MDKESMLRVVGIAGSLRIRSYNKALLQAAIGLAPPDISIIPFDISGVPFFNSDVEAQGNPEGVVALKNAINDANGVLFVTPEYNYGITGVLKNTIDWATRGSPGPRTSPLAYKPVFIMGSSGSIVGTARAQQQLREAMIEPAAFVMQTPQILVSRHMEKFDDNLELVDLPTREMVSNALLQFGKWIRMVQGL
jgi:chromate reductase